MNVLPQLAVPDVRYDGSANTIPSSGRCGAFGTVQYFADLVLGQFRAAVAFAFIAVASTFFVSIPHVVLMRSNPKMKGVAARGIVACVQDLESRGDRSKPRFPSKSVGFNGFSSMSGIAVSIWVFCASPIPASIFTLGRTDIDFVAAWKAVFDYIFHLVTLLSFRSLSKVIA